MKDLPISRRDALAGSLGLAAAAATTADALAADPGKAFDCFEVGEQQGLASLRRVQRKAAAPGPGEVLVATRAAALNYRDIMILEGRYGARKSESRIPLGDGAGDIVAIGDGVIGYKVGDRVTAPHFLSWTDGEFSPSVFASDLGSSHDGWLSQFALLPASALVRLPEGLSYETAAALGAAGITAWTVLETLGQIKPGDTVLTLGTGGVAILALQIAKMNGARVAITSSSDEKLAIARELGANITVNYRKNPQWQDAVRSATGGRGVDIVVETVGFGTLPQSLACCAPNARIGILGGFDSGAGKPMDLSALYLGNIVLKGITSGSRRMLADLLTASAANGLEPRIDRRFGFADAAKAYDYLAEAGHVGKIIINEFK
jgi:NADPH:quinone reductase-like Zn-dependent oxidoreductase